MTELEEAFDLYNSRYFRGRLPKCKVVWDKKIKHFGEYQPWYTHAYKTDQEAETARRSGEYKVGELTHTIRIGYWSKKQGRQWRLTLLHEMVHLKLHKERGTHGPKFQKEMKRLAKMGAFNTLW